MDIMLKGEMNGIETAEIVRNQYSIAIYLTYLCWWSQPCKSKSYRTVCIIFLKPFSAIRFTYFITRNGSYKTQKEQEVERERDMLYSLVENKEKVF
jgi:hypothetical protein